MSIDANLIYSGMLLMNSAIKRDFYRKKPQKNPLMQGENNNIKKPSGKLQNHKIILHAKMEMLNLAVKIQQQQLENQFETESNNQTTPKYTQFEFDLKSYQKELETEENGLQYQFEVKENGKQYQQYQSQNQNQFQAKENGKKHQLMQELEEFKAKVKWAIHLDRKQFEFWKLQQEEEFIRQRDALLHAYNLEQDLKHIQEQKREKDRPIYTLAEDLFQESLQNIEKNPKTLLLLLSPPIITNDTATNNQTITNNLKFPPVEKKLNQMVRDFVSYYAQNHRPIKFKAGEWITKKYSDESATDKLFRDLKAIPTLILESDIEGYDYFFKIGFWASNFPEARFENILSFSWKELLFNYAKTRANNWYLIREKAIQNGENPKTIDEDSDDLVDIYNHNLKIAAKEERNKKRGMSLEMMKRSYQILNAEYEELREFLGICHCIFFGLFADEYFLLHQSIDFLQPPLLPKALAYFKIWDKLKPQETQEFLLSIVEFYENIYNILAETQPAKIPELRLDLVQSFIYLPQKRYALKQIAESSKAWFKNQGLTRSKNFIQQMTLEMTRQDLPYAKKFNQCAVMLGWDNSYYIDLELIKERNSE